MPWANPKKGCKLTDSRPYRHLKTQMAVFVSLTARYQGTGFEELEQDGI